MKSTMFFRLGTKKLLTFFTLALTSASVFSQEKTLTNIDIPYHNAVVTLDGELNENVWQKAKTVTLDIVNSPRNNTPSPLKTSAKIFENGHSLFIAFIAEDPEPQNILAYYADRDTRWDDDLVGIKFDPQNNHRLNYEFIVNPLGMQMDGIQNHITGEKNTLWDGIWHSNGKLTNNGFIVEMQIPFSILTFDDSDSVKQWPFELFRIYPRDTWLRVSHVKLDKNIACTTCQYPLAKGFKTASSKESVRITPSLVIKNEKSRDIYNAEDNWQNEDDIELGADLRWAMDSNTLINATINPDFSFVEADAAQLNVNENFSLNFDEKRQFFLENSEYFSSNFDLIYTRNIADPSYGVKVTGTKQNHTYGAFISKDKQTNFILPGNLSSDVASIDYDSHASAYKYRFDANDDFSIGAIATIRKADSYHNYVTGIDGKYQLSDSNSLLAQFIYSDTEYPSDLFENFCNGVACVKQLRISCFSITCPYNEQVTRARKNNSFADKAYKIDFQHRSEFWHFDASHQNIGNNFRADLGFITQVDFRQNNLELKRNFFTDEENSWWQQASVSTLWDIKHNENGELLEKTLSATAAIDGPLQSRYELTLLNIDEVGLRYDPSIIDIDGNTSKFAQTQYQMFTSFKPLNSLYLEFFFTHGDKIDYAHDRLGDLNELESYLSWFATQHLEVEVSHVISQLDYQGEKVYEANILDSRINYQFDAHSQLKLSVIYYDTKRPIENNPSNVFDEQQKELSTQLLYSYKLNPQTVFYLGYSDSSYQDDYLQTLKKDNKTFFSKISYAWMQ